MQWESKATKKEAGWLLGSNKFNAGFTGEGSQVFGDGKAAARKPKQRKQVVAVCWGKHLKEKGVSRWAQFYRGQDQFLYTRVNRTPRRSVKRQALRNAAANTPADQNTTVTTALYLDGRNKKIKSV